MQITGTVHTVHEPVEKNNYTSRKLWLNTDEGTQYPQLIELEAGGAKVSLFDNLKQGDAVTLDVNLRGRQWNDKVFNSLSVWKVTKGAAATPAETPQVQAAQQPYNGPGSVDDLPF